MQTLLRSTTKFTANGVTSPSQGAAPSVGCHQTRDPGLNWLDPNIDPAIFRGQTINFNCHLKYIHALEDQLKHTDLNPHKPLNVECLVKHGWVFQNRIGMGGRAIIQQVGDRDYSDKLLLTREEVEYALPYMITERVRDSRLSLADLASRMLDFGRAGVLMKDIKLMSGEQSNDWRNPISVATGDTTDNHHNGLALWFERYRVNFKKLDWDERSGVSAEVLKKLKEVGLRVSDNLKGIAVSNFVSRREGNGVRGVRSPILTESDTNLLYLPSNLEGIKIFPGDIEKQVRISTITAYLASRGVCNTGQPDDWDQRYLTLDGFMKIIAEPGELPQVSALEHIAASISANCRDELFGRLAEAMKPTCKRREMVSLWRRFLSIFRGDEPGVSVQLTGEDLRILADDFFDSKVREYPDVARKLYEAPDILGRIKILRDARARHPELCEL